MDREIDAAVQFICGLMRARSLSLDLVEMFRTVLCEVMYGRYKGHWFPDKPYKGSAYRCMRINHHSIDPLILTAAHRVGLTQSQLQSILPHQLTIWVDPREVSYRFGEDGSVATLHETTNPRIELDDDDDLGSAGSGSRTSSVVSADSVKSSPSQSPTPSSPTDEDDDPIMDALPTASKAAGPQYLGPSLLVTSS